MLRAEGPLLALTFLGILVVSAGATVVVPVGPPLARWPILAAMGVGLILGRRVAGDIYVRFLGTSGRFWWVVAAFGATLVGAVLVVRSLIEIVQALT